MESSEEEESSAEEEEEEESGEESSEGDEDEDEEDDEDDEDEEDEDAKPVVKDISTLYAEALELEASEPSPDIPAFYNSAMEESENEERNVTYFDKGTQTECENVESGTQTEVIPALGSQLRLGVSESCLPDETSSDRHMVLNDVQHLSSELTYLLDDIKNINFGVDHASSRPQPYSYPSYASPYRFSPRNREHPTEVIWRNSEKTPTLASLYQHRKKNKLRNAKKNQNKQPDPVYDEQDLLEHSANILLDPEYFDKSKRRKEAKSSTLRATTYPPPASSHIVPKKPPKPTPASRFLNKHLKDTMDRSNRVAGFM